MMNIRFCKVAKVSFLTFVQKVFMNLSSVQCCQLDICTQIIK